MKRNENYDQINKKVKKAFKNAAPDELGPIMTDIAQGSKNVVSFTPKKRNITRRLISAAAALIICAVGLMGANRLYVQNAVDSLIAFEVNPSLEIEINKNERVLSVKPLNIEAQTVIGDMELKGSDLDAAVNALIGSMLKNGYISEIANSILISVDNDDIERGLKLQEKLTGDVSKLLDTDAFTGAVLSQTIKDNENTQTLAKQYDISLGKAQLISQMTKQNTALDEKDLSQLSINQLNLLGSGLDGVESVGTASDKSYIGRDAAINAALTHAGINVEIRYSKAELDLEKGIMVYEVEFGYNEYEFDYDIDAKTGEVINSRREYDDDYIQPVQTKDEANYTQGNTTSDAKLTSDEAKAVVIDHAGLKADQVTFTKCKLDHDDGRLEYDIEFITEDHLEYEYEIDAVTGKVYKYSHERADYIIPQATAVPNSNTHKTTEPGSPAPSAQETEKPVTAFISREEALDSAFKKAGIDASEAGRVECELDRDDGRQVYEIEFKSGGYEYSCDVDALTGAVYDFEKERDD